MCLMSIACGLDLGDALQGMQVHLLPSAEDLHNLRIRSVHTVTYSRPQVDCCYLLARKHT